MEKAKTSDPAQWSKVMRDVCHPPGEEVDDIVAALEMVRAGKDIDFIGAGAIVDFDEKGDQINRTFLHQAIEGGKNKIVGVITMEALPGSCALAGRASFTQSVGRGCANSVALIAPRHLRRPARTAPRSRDDLRAPNGHAVDFLPKPFRSRFNV